MKKFALTLLLTSYFLLPVFSFAQNFPSPQGFVTDTAGVFSQAARSSLESELRAFAQTKGYQIAVLTVPDLQGDTIEDYATKLFEKWKIGDKKLDTGVLFVVSVNDRKDRIEVGYGAEPVLTDAAANQILLTVVNPFFKQNQYAEGIVAGARAVEGVLSGEAQPASNNYKSGINFSYSTFFGFFIIFQLLVSYMARTKSWWFGGVVGGAISLILVFIFAASMLILIKGLIVLASIILGLVIDYFVSKHGPTPRGPSIWFLGGGSRGSGGFGGGFGGFGGGRSGGGGASGSW